MDSYITQADLEARFDPAQVRRAFCDDGSGLAGPRLSTALYEASRIGDSILGLMYTSEQARQILCTDKAVKGALCRIAMVLGVQGKAEWITDATGASALDERLESARKFLKEVAQGKAQPATEAGENPKWTDRVNVPEDPQFLFTPSVNKPNPGGY